VGSVYCYDHTKFFLGTTIGMKTQGLGHADMNRYLAQMASQCRTPATLQHYKKKNMALFRKEHRGILKSDLRKVFRYPHNETHVTLTREEINWLGARIGLTRATLDEWEENGTINLPIFEWFPTKFREEVVDVEFKVYEYHNRPVNNQPTSGWLRNMIHAIHQQIIRQDLGYWILYMFLRWDGHHELVTYPYWAKFAKPNDPTAFTHMDQNPKDMKVKPELKLLIQGSVSIDDEFQNDKMPTIIIKGMHLWHDRWVADLVARGADKGGPIQNVESGKQWTPADKAKYGADFEPVPCRPYNVRVSRPDLAHGARGPAEVERRTILPWHMYINANGFLETNVSAGTFDDLNKAHRDLMPGPTTPSGLPPKDGIPLYPFPAAIKISGLGPISDALVCQQS
jgi:hypothetical protein